MPNKPSLIGVTGGIGSGKSTVCKIFEVMGYLVYYADDRARWLMSHDAYLKGEIISLFGAEAYHEEGLNRAFIGSKVFRDKTLMTQLNSKVHPVVAEDAKKWVDANSDQKLLFYEAALIFEIESYKRMDATILVTAPEKLRMQRVLTRDKHRTKEDVHGIIKTQMKDEEKVPLADYLIVNNEEKSILAQLMEVHNQLLNRRN